MINLFIVLAISGIVFYLMSLIEESVIPKLSTDSKFRKWWRSHIIGTEEEFGD